MAEPSKAVIAAEATAAIEQPRARDFRFLHASDIKRLGFYSEPFARQSGLARIAREIKAAVRIISGTRWPDEDEAAVPQLDPQIAKLRQQCSAELRTVKLYFRDYEDMADAAPRAARSARLSPEAAKRS